MRICPALGFGLGFGFDFTIPQRRLTLRVQHSLSRPYFVVTVEDLLLHTVAIGNMPYDMHIFNTIRSQEVEFTLRRTTADTESKEWTASGEKRRGFHKIYLLVKFSLWCRLNCRSSQYARA